MEGAFRIKNPSEMGQLNSMGYRLVLILGVTPRLGSPCKACASPRTDQGLSCTFCLGHVGATSSFLGAGMVRTMLDVSTRLLAACAGTETSDVRVSAPQSPAPCPCHRRPASLHLHPASSPHPRADIFTGPQTPSKGLNSILKQVPSPQVGKPLVSSNLGSKLLFFSGPVLHQPGNPQEKAHFKGKGPVSLCTHTPPLHLCKGYSDDTQGCWAAAPKPQQPQH